MHTEEALDETGGATLLAVEQTEHTENTEAVEHLDAVESVEPVEDADAAEAADEVEDASPAVTESILVVESPVLASARVLEVATFTADQLVADATGSGVTGSRPIPSCGCTSHPRSTVSRRRCWAAGGSSSAGRRRDSTSGHQPTICAYYDDLLADRMLASGRVEFFAGCEYLGTAPSSRASRVRDSRCRSGAGSSTHATSPRTYRRSHRRSSGSPTVRG